MEIHKISDMNFTWNEIIVNGTGPNNTGCPKKICFKIVSNVLHKQDLKKNRTILILWTINKDKGKKTQTKKRKDWEKKIEGQKDWKQKTERQKVLKTLRC